MSRLHGKIALVTGSSRGIGAAIATLFAQEGAAVAVHGRDIAALDGVRNAIAATGSRTMSVSGDVTSSADVDRMRLEIERGLGPVEILVANAGANLAPPGPIEAVDEQAWKATVDTNLTATFLTIKSFLPGMKARKAGCIITLSSAAARRPHPHSPIGYAAAKAGIQILTQDVAAQAGPFGVRVNCIAPETILTERNVEQIPEDTKQMLVGTHPIRRLGTPDDVARAAVFLASEDASWITGIVVDVAGGAVMA